MHMRQVKNGRCEPILGVGCTESDWATEDARELAIVVRALVLKCHLVGRPVDTARLPAAYEEEGQRELVVLRRRHGHPARETGDARLDNQV